MYAEPTGRGRGRGGYRGRGRGRGRGGGHAAGMQQQSMAAASPFSGTPSVTSKTHTPPQHRHANVRGVGRGGRGAGRGGFPGSQASGHVSGGGVGVFSASAGAPGMIDTRTGMMIPNMSTGSGYRGRGGGRGRGGHRNQPFARGPHDGTTGMQTPKPWGLMIAGLPPHARPEDFLAWINQAIGSQLGVSDVGLEGTPQGIMMLVPSRDYAQAIKQLSGQVFFDSKLTIRFHNPNYNGSGSGTGRGGGAAGSSGRGGGGAGGAQQLGRGTSGAGGRVDLDADPAQFAAVFAPLVAARYTQATQLLDLSGLRAVPELKGIRIQFNRQFTSVLLELLGKITPDAASINLANNAIRYLSGFGLLHKYLPNAVNLDLTGNQIADFGELDNLTGTKIKQLILTGNPCAGSLPPCDYVARVTRTFPSLEFLDGQRMASVMKFNIPSLSESVVLPPVQANFFDSADSQSIAVVFLNKFISLYDVNRAALASVYTDQSIFSLNVDNSDDKSSAGANGASGKKNRDRDFPGHYVQFSRNLTRVRDLDRRVSSLKVGQAAIVQQLMALPETSHQADALQVDVFVIRALPGVSCQLLQINSHGVFYDVPAGGRRHKWCFDRTMLLVPADPGSLQHQNGWPLILLNDQLHIRPFQAAVTGAAPPVEHAAAVVAAQGQAQVAQQDAMVQQLAQITGLTLAAARQCLTQCNWDGAAAQQAFQVAKSAGQLPPSAFQHS